MLYYERIYHDEHIDRYIYYPDGDRSRPGIVEFTDQEMTHVEKAKGDECGPCWGMCWHIFRNGRDPEKGTIAWY